MTTVARRRLLYLLAVLLLGVSGGAPTPARASSDLAHMDLEQLMQIPVESVSGVSKYTQSTRRAPAGVTVFTAEDIRRNGWRTLADALRAAPGMHVRNDRFYDYLGNRGFTRPLDYNSRTLILVNGHRVNDSIYQQGSIGTDFLLDLDLADRIEIIQGPGSSVYGSNAFFGTVNVIPKQGRDYSGSQVSATAGTEPSLQARATVGDRTQGGVEYLVSISDWRSRGEEDFTLSPDWRAADPSFTATRARGQDDLERQSIFASATWRNLEAEATYSRRRKEVPPELYRTRADAPGYGIDERAYALLRTETEPSSDSILNAKVATDLYYYNGRFYPALAGLREQRPYAKALSLGAELRWRQTFDPGWVWMAGVEYQENLRQDLGRNDAIFGPVVRVRKDSRYVSPFSQAEWEFALGWIASVGARFDYYDADQQRITPRLGLIREWGERTTIKALYGESFRAPNIEERFGAEVGVVPNPELKPETNQTYELILDHRLDTTWRLVARTYWVDSRDLVTMVPTNANPLVPDEITYINKTNYRTAGGDLSLTAHFDNGVTLRTSSTYQETEDRTGAPVPDAPRWLGKLHASAPVAGLRWLRASAELHYVGNRRELSGAYVGDYLVANATLRATPIAGRWDISLSIYNLADERWNDPSNTGRIAAPPRVAVLRVACDF